MTSYYREELESLPEMELAANRVYAMAGLGPDDTDAACLYDAFSSEITMQLESFGFCGPGEAKDLVREGALDIDGRPHPGAGLANQRVTRETWNLLAAVAAYSGQHTIQCFQQLVCVGPVEHQRRANFQDVAITAAEADQNAFFLHGVR